MKLREPSDEQSGYESAQRVEALSAPQKEFRRNCEWASGQRHDGKGRSNFTLLVNTPIGIEVSGLSLFSSLDLRWWQNRTMGPELP